jgi:hypothetical protein
MNEAQTFFSLNRQQKAIGRDVCLSRAKEKKRIVLSGNKNNQ